jgi:FtsP/CotA-like multicopper oxidase with cupredoxin domain
MGIVVAYDGALGKAQRQTPRPFKWDYKMFGAPRPAAEFDQAFEMLFAKDNAADGGFDRWTINGVAYPDSMAMAEPMLRLTPGRRYRRRLRNESDDIHPFHLQRPSFEVPALLARQRAV